ncbi:MAG: SCP2 sterol-binding domain-containing protein [Candidatus Hodarchaeales archaeon]
MDLIEDMFQRMDEVIDENDELKSIIENWNFTIIFNVNDPEMVFTVKVNKDGVKILTDRVNDPTAEMITSFPVLAKLFTGTIDPHKAIFEADEVEVKGSLLAVQKLKELMELAFARLENEG